MDAFLKGSIYYTGTRSVVYPPSSHVLRFTDSEMNVNASAIVHHVGWHMTSTTGTPSVHQPSAHQEIPYQPSNTLTLVKKPLSRSTNNK